MSKGFVAGFDVGGTNIRAEVLDGAGRPEPTTAARRARPDSAEGILEAITSIVTQLEDERGARVRAVGVGCAGLVDRAGIVATSPNIPAIGDFALATGLQERLGRPVVAENDATAAAWAEVCDGAAAGAAGAAGAAEAGAAAGAAALAGACDVVFVTLGTGIGGALISGGRLHRGAGGLAGEVGHMVIAPDGPACPCGRRGCWERLASGGALSRAARRTARAGGAPGLLAAVDGQVEALRGEHVGALAAAGDPVAQALLAEVAGWVALGLNNLILLFSPEVVVLGGGLSGLGEVFLEPVRAALAEVYVEAHCRPPVEVRAARFGDRAGAIGAALLAADLPT